MKYFLFIFIFLFSIETLSAQKLGTDFLPPKSSQTPSWAHMLYEKEINALELQKAYAEYYLDHPFEKTIYTQYYKRWLRGNDHEIQENGEIQILPTIEPTKQSKYRGPNSEWSLVGPSETFRPFWDVNTQPAVPWQVNIYAFDIAASNPNILYACPETGGVFKSIDKGQNWSSASDTIKLGTLTALAVHPTDPNIAYASGNQHIFKTSDGGLSWQLMQTITNFSCNDIVVFPSNPNVVFAAGSNGLYQSINAGVNWNLVLGVSGSIYDIELNPQRDSTMYLLTKPSGDSAVRFYRSFDGAQNFSSINNGWATNAASAGRLSNTVADTNFVYAVLLMAGTINAPYIMRTMDGGSSWAHLCTGITNSLTGNSSLPLGMSNGQGYYDLSIMASSQNAGEVIVGSTTAYKSVDSGQTFTPVGGYVGSFPIHPDIQEMKMIGNDAWIATDGGLTLSTDYYSNTVNAVSLNKGIYGSDFWGFGQSWNEDILVGGRYHNGNTAMSDNFPTGKALRLGGGEAGTGYAMLGKRGYVAHSDIGTDIIPTSFSGNTGSFGFSLYPNEDGYGFDASEIEFHPTCYNHLYLGKDSSLWKSIDGGISYAEVYNFHQRVKKFEVCRSNPDVMYLATNINLYKSIDGGASWTVVTRPSGCSINRLAITTSFTDENELWICSRYNASNNKIFKSTDGGATWINLTTPLINGFNFYTITHQANTNGGVYITGLDNGVVFYRNNSMNDWANFSAKLPKEYSPVSTKAFYKKGKLRTAGNRGIWEIDFYEQSLPLAQPTVDKLISACPRDTFYFDDFSVLDHSTASWSWSFPGATYVSANNIRNPKVKYGAVGVYTASLTIQQGALTSTKSLQIEVLNSICEVDTIAGYAVNFGGNTQQDYVSLPPLGLVTNELTVTAWVKVDGIQADYCSIFMHDGTTAGFNFLPGNNHLGYHWPGGQWWWDSGLEVPDGEWAHVAMVVSPTEMKLYVNGIGATHSIALQTVDFLDNIIRLGSYKGWGGRYFKGLIDEVAIYKKSMNENEIRELRHLTKLPANDTNLVRYYQFNEANGIVFDKIGSLHASLFGAQRVNSTAPIGGGSSYRMTVNNGGMKDFIGTDIKLYFPNGGSNLYPDGDLVVTKLNVAPDQAANANPIQSKYWILNNYGANLNFSSLDSAVFAGIPAFANVMASDYELYQRGDNAEGNSWGSVKDICDNYTINGANSTMQFSLNNSISTSGQYSLNCNKPLQFPDGVTSIHEKDFNLRLFPNPTNDILHMRFSSNKQDVSSNLRIYSMTGQLLLETMQKVHIGENDIMFSTLPLSNGNYFMELHIHGIKWTRKFEVLKN